jgi:SPP1 gp7 family putative phage head morphogenesis protein
LNKQEREFYLGQLETEKTVLKELKRQYERAHRDIVNRIRILQSDELTQSRIYHIDYQKALQARVEAILEKLHADEYDTIHRYLKETYTDSFVGAMYTMGVQDGIHVITPIDQNAAAKAIITDSKLSTTLYGALGYDMGKLKKHVREEITRGIASGLPYAKIARNVSNYTNMPFANAKRIVRTEGHRIQEASAEDARQAAKARGADVVKMWDASLDSKTRPLHRRLDGQIRELDEPFESGGYTAMYPGDFGDPSQDCNCRCVALTRARWEMDEKELEIIKKRAEYFGLDKSESFEDFKKKYLKAIKEETK